MTFVLKSSTPPYISSTHCLRFFFWFNNDLDDEDVLPNELKVGKEYMISYGSRQYEGRGRQERHIAVERVGNTSECEYYKGYDPKPGYWVTDHSDNTCSREKFFLTDRIIYVRNLSLDELI